MADIVNPLVVRWSNEHARRFADVWATFYNAAKVAGIVWDSQGLTALCPNTADLIADGSAVDGRGPLTGASLRSLKTLLDNFVADAEANTNAKRNAILAVAVNPRG